MRNKKLLLFAILLLTLTAAFSAGCQKKATVTFETFGGSTVDSITVSATNEMNMPAQTPTKSEYRFLGWYLDPELKKPADFPLNITSDITLYAKWQGKNKITFDSDGGSIVSDISGFKGDYISGPSEPERAGYRFDGWYTDLTYVLPYQFYDGRQIHESDITLYAKWTKVFQLSFATPDDVSEITPVLAAQGETVKEPAAPVRTGWIFVGWYNETTDEPYQFGSMPAHDVEVVAKWKPLGTNVKLTFINGNSTKELTGLTEGGTIAIPVFNTTETGLSEEYYSFAGWYGADGFKYDFEKGAPSSDATLTALWVRNAKYALITFKNEQGEIDSIFVEKNKPLTGTELTKNDVAINSYQANGLQFPLLVYKDISFTVTD